MVKIVKRNVKVTITTIHYLSWLVPNCESIVKLTNPHLIGFYPDDDIVVQ